MFDRAGALLNRRLGWMFAGIVLVGALVGAAISHTVEVLLHRHRPVS